MYRIIDWEKKIKKQRKCIKGAVSTEKKTRPENSFLFHQRNPLLSSPLVSVKVIKFVQVLYMNRHKGMNMEFLITWHALSS